MEELEITRILLAGAATERCLVQSAIDAREMRLEVTVLAAACATADKELETLLWKVGQQDIALQTLLSSRRRRPRRAGKPGLS